MAIVIPFQVWALPESITLVADKWCPYNCSPHDKNPGYVIEIARAIYEPKGIRVAYEIVPWTRAIHDTRKGNYTAIIGATKEEAPDFIFPNEIIGYSEYGFYTHHASDWRYQNPNSLIRQILGAVEGYSYSPEINRFIKEHAHHREQVQVVNGENAVKQNLRKLIAKRIDVVIEDVNVMAFMSHQLNLNNQIRYAGSVPESDSHIFLGFSPHHPDSRTLAEIFDKGMIRLQQSGELYNILRMYKIQPWKEHNHAHL